MKKFTVKENTTLKAFTDNVCPQASFCFARLLRARDVRVNGAKTGENVPLVAGDEVAYYMTAREEARPAYSVLYSDELVTVVDKESGVNAEGVFAMLQAERETYFIHRLDRNTEGIMIFAHTKEAAEELLSAFRMRRVEKVYYARVIGKMSKRHAVEEAYLTKDEAHALVTVGASNRSGGEKIVTEYEVLEEKGGESTLKIRLHTGKTHQIRAHLAFLRHPVVGDMKYGDAAYNRACHCTRQRLIAKELTLQTEGILAYLRGKTFLSQKNL